MEIPPSRWSTADRQRGARPYPKNELREPALGCAAYPRRASEARLRRRPVDSLEVHGTEARSPLANMEDLRNHADGIASIDLFVVPTIAFEQLFAFLILGHGRRQLLWFAVTRHPTAEWLARQITEAFPWDTAPAYIVRDNDRAFGSVFRRRSAENFIQDA